jgi:hypothetical protein
LKNPGVEKDYFRGHRSGYSLWTAMLRKYFMEEVRQIDLHDAEKKGFNSEKAVRGGGWQFCNGRGVRSSNGFVTVIGPQIVNGGQLMESLEG